MKTHTTPLFRRGFTLIELVIVMSIITILAGLSVAGFGLANRRQNDSQAEIQINLLSYALEEYKLDNGVYPLTGNSNSLFTLLYWNGASGNGKIYLTDLDPSSKKQGWIQGTGAAAIIVDPWGKEYIYVNGGDPSAKNPDFDLSSMGKDGLPGTPDDIDNY